MYWWGRIALSCVVAERPGCRARWCPASLTSRQFQNRTDIRVCSVKEGETAILKSVRRTAGIILCRTTCNVHADNGQYTGTDNRVQQTVGIPWCPAFAGTDRRVRIAHHHNSTENMLDAIQERFHDAAPHERVKECARYYPL